MREPSIAGQIAPRVVLYPVGSDAPCVPPGWLSLPHIPHERGGVRVFGDGSHATTRLCAAVVDLLCRRHSPEAVLDVGTGTGILARIARARGATFVVGVDIDPIALAASSAHAALDTDVPQIHVADQPPDHWGPCFDLIVANILEGLLSALASSIRAALAPDGLVLLSGFTKPQAPSLRVLYESIGLVLAGESYMDEWALLAFRA
jgi:ribosomal protein L11 methyltransferase